MDKNNMKNNIIYYDKIIKEANNRRKEMASSLDELERHGYLSEEYIVYALRFLTTAQLKYILSLLKLILRSELNQNI